MLTRRNLQEEQKWFSRKLQIAFFGRRPADLRCAIAMNQEVFHPRMTFLTVGTIVTVLSLPRLLLLLLHQEHHDCVSCSILLDGGKFSREPLLDIILFFI